MKRVETKKQFRLDWGDDSGFVDLEPEEATAAVCRRGTRYTDPEDQMEFHNPEDLDKFADELKKAAAEMKKWPAFKKASS